MDIVNSAKALIIDHDKMAFLRIRDRDKVYYALPGGSQKSEELLSETVKRECIEELGVEIEVKELLFVSEGLTREAHHRVDFVFRCEVISEHIQEISQPDDNQCGTEWLTIEELNNKLIYPNTLFNQLCAYLNKQPHSLYLGEDRD